MSVTSRRADAHGAWNYLLDDMFRRCARTKAGSRGIAFCVEVVRAFPGSKHILQHRRRVRRIASCGGLLSDLAAWILARGCCGGLVSAAPVGDLLIR